MKNNIDKRLTKLLNNGLISDRFVKYIRLMDIIFNVNSEIEDKDHKIDHQKYRLLESKKAVEEIANIYEQTLLAGYNGLIGFDETRFDDYECFSHTGLLIYASEIHEDSIKKFLYKLLEKAKL